MADGAGGRVRPTDVVPWPAVRALFEAGTVPVTEIAAAFGVDPSTVRRRAAADGWAAPAGRPRVRRGTAPERGGVGRRTLIDRLFAAFERQMDDIETRLADAGEAGGERDARMLGVLAKTLETLIDLERAATGGEADKQGAPDLDAAREEIARRLERLGQPL